MSATVLPLMQAKTTNNLTRITIKLTINMEIYPLVKISVAFRKFLTLNVRLKILISVKMMLFRVVTLKP